MSQFLTAGLISFDEYVLLLPDDSVVPKAKLQGILENREGMMQEPAMQEQVIPEEPQSPDYSQLIDELLQLPEEARAQALSEMQIPEEDKKTIEEVIKNEQMSQM